MQLPQSDSIRGFASAKEHCADALRSMLHSGALNSGDRLNLKALSEEFGVSTTPVREAAWQLRTEGLLEVTPRVGIFVRFISDDEVLDIYDIKAALEPLMAQWATERGAESERRRYANGFAALSRAAARSDLAVYVRLIEERRQQLMRIAGSKSLCDTLEVIDGRVRLLRYRNLAQPGSMDASVRQHRLVAEAIGQGEAALAKVRMAEHMTDAGLRIRNLLSQRELAPLLHGRRPGPRPRLDPAPAIPPKPRPRHRESVLDPLASATGPQARQPKSWTSGSGSQ